MIKKLLIMALGLIATAPSAAWVAANNQTITDILLWEGTEAGTYPVYFQTSDGFWCYFLTSEKTIYATVLALYMSGKPAEVYCYDAAETIVGGVSAAHKLHRLRPSN